MLGADGEEDVGLLVDHLLSTGKDSLGASIVPLANQRAHLVAYLVIYGPHHVLRAGDIILGLEQRID